MGSSDVYLSDGFQAACEQQPEWLVVAADCLVRLKSGFYPKDVVDCVLQRWDQRLAIEDAFAFALVWSDLMDGLLARCSIQLGESPYKDRMVERNNAALARLPPPFHARFVGGPGGPDGDVRWDRAITSSLCYAQPDGTELSARALFPAGSASLEVGYCDPGTFLERISIGCQPVARWPYGSTVLHLFIPTARFAARRSAHVDGCFETDWLEA